jgi:hypothetical protein
MVQVLLAQTGMLLTAASQSPSAFRKGVLVSCYDQVP